LFFGVACDIKAFAEAAFPDAERVRDADIAAHAGTAGHAKAVAAPSGRGSSSNTMVQHQCD